MLLRGLHAYRRGGLRYHPGREGPGDRRAALQELCAHLYRSGTLKRRLTEIETKCHFIVSTNARTSSSSCSSSTVRGSSRSASRKMRATMGVRRVRSRRASSSKEQGTTVAERASSVVGSVSPGSDPPPTVDM